MQQQTPQDNSQEYIALFIPGMISRPLASMTRAPPGITRFVPSCLYTPTSDTDMTADYWR